MKITLGIYTLNMSNGLEKGDSIEAEFCKRTRRIRVAKTNSVLRIGTLDWTGDPDPVSEERICSRLWLGFSGDFHFQILSPLSILVQVTIFWLG